MTFADARAALIKLAAGKRCSMSYSELIDESGAVYSNDIFLHLDGKCICSRTFEGALAELENGRDGQEPEGVGPCN